MSRPTPAQIVYGSATVVFATLAMLLLSGAGSGPALAAVALAALALGVTVALAVGRRAPRERAAATDSLPRRRTPAHACAPEHSLHG